MQVILTKEHIISISIWKNELPFGEEWKCIVKLENGNTVHNEKFEGATMEDVEIKIKDFIKTI